jgi:hypothetical protein
MKYIVKNYSDRMLLARLCKWINMSKLKFQVKNNYTNLNRWLPLNHNYRDVTKAFGHCNCLLYISYKTTIFENIIPKSILVRFWWNIYQQKRVQILNVHDLNTNLNYLSSNVLSLYCIFDLQNLVLCLNRELIKIIDYKFMLRL